MPYIPSERRASLDVIIDGLVARLCRQPNLCRGDLNYVVTRLVLETLNEDSYHSLSDCVSVLRDAADEIQRRLLGPYEDTALMKNGDIQCFQKPYVLPKMYIKDITYQEPLPPVAEAACEEDGKPTFIIKDAKCSKWFQMLLDNLHQQMTLYEEAQNDESL